MRFIVLHLEEDTLRGKNATRHAARLGLPIEFFPADFNEDKTLGIARSMRNVALAAVEENWGLDTVFCQDDIRFRSRVPEPTAPLTVYGTLSASVDGLGHVCPHAFAATDVMWELLTEVFDGETKVCHAWRSLVDEHGTILNVVSHPNVPRAVEVR